jgi:hypothetical protein
VSYAAVPLYKIFCSMTGFGGTTQRPDEKKSSLVKPVPGGKVIKVLFSSNVHSTMCWDFVPTQREVKVVPGETALAFYTVSNPSNKAITGNPSHLLINLSLSLPSYNFPPPTRVYIFQRSSAFRSYPNPYPNPAYTFSNPYSGRNLTLIFNPHSNPIRCRIVQFIST